MKLAVAGTSVVRAHPSAVWAALHDPEIVSRCIPGCRSLTRVSDRAFELLLEVRFGPVRLGFEGTVDVTESDAPRHYRLVGRGAGSRGGEATGTATIKLVEQAGCCRILYSIEAEAGGRLSLGSPRILSGVGKAIATVFAARFGEVVEGRSAPAASPILQQA